MTFTDPDKGAFRETLKSAGFYPEWKGKFGDEAWAILEKAVDQLNLTTGLSKEEQPHWAAAGRPMQSCDCDPGVSWHMLFFGD